MVEAAALGAFAARLGHDVVPGYVVGCGEGLSLTVVLLRTTMYNSLMVSMTVSEARRPSPILSRVEGGEEITITRHGRPAAVLVRPDALRSRRAEAALEDAADSRSCSPRRRDSHCRKARG